MVSTNPKVTMEEFADWKRKIPQEIDNKIISLKHRIIVHKTSSVLKQDAVIEYLNELHKKYVLVPIDKAANNIAVICKKYYVTDKNHGHVLTGDLRIITNSKLRKLVSKGPNFREAMSINWNKCKREIEIGLDSGRE